jgi:hypothetical protein
LNVAEAALVERVVAAVEQRLQSSSRRFFRASELPAAAALPARPGPAQPPIGASGEDAGEGGELQPSLAGDGGGLDDSVAGEDAFDGGADDDAGAGGFAGAGAADGAADAEDAPAGGQDAFDDLARFRAGLRGIRLPPTFPKFGTTRGFTREYGQELKLLSSIWSTGADLMRLAAADLDERTLRRSLARFGTFLATQSVERKTGIWVSSTMSPEVARFYRAVDQHPEITRAAADQLTFAIRLAQGESALRDNRGGGARQQRRAGGGNNFYPRGAGFATGRGGGGGARDDGGDALSGFVRRQQQRFPFARRRPTPFERRGAGNHPASSGPSARHGGADAGADN